jgi:TonB family protein
MPVYFLGRLDQWINLHLNYPPEARDRGEQGRCIIEFTIDKNGPVRNAFVKATSGYQLLDAEALRVVNTMLPWWPGTQDGKRVDVVMTLPITFKLDD